MEKESKKDILQFLMEKGKAKGSLTYDEIMTELDKIDFDPEQIDKLYETLESNGIEVINDFDIDINVMIRRSIKDLIGKEDVLLELKNKYNLTYYLERVAILMSGSDASIQKLSLDDDIIEFMYKTKTSDDLDYHIH